MALIQKDLGNRIRLFRKQAGLTQQDLAKKLGLNSSETVSQIEKGNRELKAWELLEVSKHLSIDLSDLLRVEKPEKNPTVLWRDAPENRAQKEAEFLKKCRDYALLEELSDTKNSKAFPQTKVDPDNLSYEQVGWIADEIRREFDLGDRPACELETTLQEKYGTKIWYLPLEEGSAASVIGPFGPAILMNSNEAPWRRNYNFAHELFHLITWESIPPKVIEHRPEIWGELESKANAFASCLLLPMDAVSMEFEKKINNGKISHGDLIGIARYFDVSSEALLYRLLNIRRLNKSTVDELLKDEKFRDADRSTMPANWWEPSKFPKRYVRLSFLSYQKGRLSKAKLCDLLDTSFFDLSAVLQEYGFDDSEGYDVEVRAA